jgi:hypothetical protein
MAVSLFTSLRAVRLADDLPVVVIGFNSMTARSVPSRPPRSGFAQHQPLTSCPQHLHVRIIISILIVPIALAPIIIIIIFFTIIFLILILLIILALPQERSGDRTGSS